jgi:hypothetical protein
MSEKLLSKVYKELCKSTSRTQEPLRKNVQWLWIGGLWRRSFEMLMGVRINGHTMGSETQMNGRIDRKYLSGIRLEIIKHLSNARLRYTI